LLLITAGGLVAEAPRPTDEAAIRAQLSGYAAARQIGDGHAQALFYAEDADEWGSGAMEMTMGRAALEKTLNSPPDPNRRFRIEPLHYSFLGNDVALVDALFYGAKAEPSGHALYVMVKRDNQWLIRSARIMRFPPAAAK
jgi:ketosteroid isomerase-like protein